MSESNSSANVRDQDFSAYALYNLLDLLPRLFHHPHCGFIFPRYLFEHRNGHLLANAILISWLGIPLSSLFASAMVWHPLAIVLLLFCVIGGTTATVFYCALWTHWLYTRPRHVRNLLLQSAH
jgi:hypothetical protein